MQTEGQTAENPQSEIIQRSVLRAGGFENADEQQRSNGRQYTLEKKLSDGISSCHGQDLLSIPLYRLEKIKR